MLVVCSKYQDSYHTAQNFDGENIDEFDEFLPFVKILPFKVFFPINR